mgnify:CR=1 FL=1
MYADCVIALRKKIELLKKDNAHLRLLVETHEELKQDLRYRLAAAEKVVEAAKRVDETRPESEPYGNHLQAKEDLRCAIADYDATKKEESNA